MTDGSFLDTIWVTTLKRRKKPSVDYHSTGLGERQINWLCERIRDMASDVWPPSLGLRRSLIITLTYLRRNRVQAELAEAHATSQPTVSRAIAALIPLLTAALADYIPAVEDLDPDVPLVIDGTVLPCWSWADHPELYSGKHHTTGVNVQIATTLAGHIVWISDPYPGSTHDLTALRNTGILDEIPANHLIADKGYIGPGMITPLRNPPGHELSDDRKKFNRQVNQRRYVIERAISHFKNWNAMHTDYRRPYATFANAITATIALYNYATAS